MKKIVLCFFLLFIGIKVTSAQSGRTEAVSVYPNPAAEYIAVKNEDAAKQVFVYNLVGRKLKTFEVVKGEKYEIGDLPNGMYLIQIVGKNDQIVATQRLQKKS